MNERSLITDISYDVICQIISWVENGSTYKSCALVSRVWHKATLAHSYKIEGMTNQLLTLMKHIPHTLLSWAGISRNSLITMDIVMDNPTFPWNWEELSTNPSISAADILNTVLDYPWQLEKICLKPDLTPEIILKHPVTQHWRKLLHNPNIPYGFITTHINIHECSSWYLSAHPGVTIDIVLANPDWGWNWEALSDNPRITLETILANKHLDWAWDRVTRKVTSLEVVYNHRDVPFNKYVLSSSVHLTLDVVRRYVYNWNWRGLSSNESLTADIVMAYLDKDWSFYYLSSHACLTIELIKAKHVSDWNWGDISSNPAINIDMVNANLGLPWDWYRLSENSNMTMQVIENNPHINWAINGLSHNPNLTAAYVLAHADLAWDWHGISWNSFGRAQHY